MTYLELRYAIVALLNKADNLSAEEVYGVIASVEAEVRFGLLGYIRKQNSENDMTYTVDTLMALHHAATSAAVQYADCARVSHRSERTMQAADDRNEANDALRTALTEALAPKGCVSNCDTCTYHHQSPAQAGYCYMFYEEPQGICGQWKDYAGLQAAKPVREPVREPEQTKQLVEKFDALQPKQEPVAWMYWQSCLNDDGTQTAPWVQQYSKFKPQDSRINRDVTPLYAAPHPHLKAMQQALEALEQVTRHFTKSPSTLADTEARIKAHKAINALREVLGEVE